MEGKNQSSIYGEMTEGITHYRIIMGRGGWGIQYRERDKNSGIVALTRARKKRINR